MKNLKICFFFEKERIVKGLVLGETLGKGTFGRGKNITSLNFPEISAIFVFELFWERRKKQAIDLP